MTASKSEPTKYEIKKCGLRQGATGTVISFVLHPHEDCSELINAPVGQVFKATFEPDGSND
jgi:hypothetical protein